MMPFGSECCSKLHVDLFLESYTSRTTHNGECCKGSKLHVGFVYMEESYTRRTTHNGILKNCTVANIAIKACLRV